MTALLNEYESLLMFRLAGIGLVGFISWMALK